MSTPQFRVQNPAMNLNLSGPNSFFVPTLDPAGNPIDVHTGYTVASFVLSPLSQPSNQAAAFIDVHTVGSFAFSTTGVTWNLTQAQANAIAMPTMQCSGLLTLTNDAGVTFSVLARPQVNIQGTLGLG